ncbi:DUF6653 family protein [Actinoplanes sp. CA-030573]|uniref:DUF6653 family protein n=1 Tax=Actinoplanes sp. CA-030573 TaxID=3239898 RepID=UPI003D949982
MSTTSAGAATATRDTKIAELFGLDGDNWMRHANPVSVGTRFAVLPLLAVSLASRDWIGWWSLIPITLSVVFMMVNPLLFPPPRSTRNWASKAVFGERIWADRNTVPLPPQYTARVPEVTYAFQLAGMVLLAYGLIVLGLPGLLYATAGIAVVQCAKAWFLDRMVLLFEDLKTTRPEYAAWETPR